MQVRFFFSFVIKVQDQLFICTVCPMGCHITVTGEGDRVDSITGYTCKRGEEYGKQEFAHPVRILTSTVKLEGADQPLLPVRSEKPVPKELLADCMKVLKAVDVKAPVKRYDVIVENICGCGVNIVASDSVG